jgi:hypothetical protein
MRSRCFPLLLLAALVAAGAPAFADAMADANAAFKRGDFPGAAQLYRAAAAEGNPDAQMLLAFMYHDGQGVPRDMLHAYMWFAVAMTGYDAASQDFIDAGNARDITAAAMTRAEVDRATAMASACLSARYKNCD